MEMAKEGPKHKSLKGSPPIATAADLGVQFFGCWITFDLASRSPFEIFAFGAITDELQVRARKGHTVNEARAYTADLGVQFLCFWVTFDIASKSPFGIFAIGGAADELQVRASCDMCFNADSKS